MTRAVERAIEDDSVLLCEAGTGVGKTFAYLVPAILSGRRVVISTANKALQEQIVHRDIPLIAELLGLEVDAVLMKGLGNYLCLRRFDELGSRAASVSESGSLGLVRQWAGRTTTGDRAELVTLPESDAIWDKVTSSTDTRIGSRCRFYESCHVTRLKRAANQARLIVVNHHLLLSHVAVAKDHPGGVLPEFDVLIIDEAHRLENVAAGFLGATVSTGSVERLFGDVERSLSTALLDGERGASTHVRLARDRAAELFQEILGGAKAQAALRHDVESREPMPSPALCPRLVDRYHALDDALGMLATVLAGHDAIAEALGHAGQRIVKLRDSLAQVLYPASDHVAWLERTGSGATLTATPADVGPILRRKLFDRGRAVVLTSATLTSLGSFDFIRARLGLTEPLGVPVEELTVEPAFDHATNALIYTPDDLPEVTEPGFASAAATRIAELLELSSGGAFILCTSHRMMRALYVALVACSGRTVLLQGEAPKSALLERFRRLGDGVLVATMSFWEGVDVPGDALALVVIDRIPFEVPTEPLTRERCRRIEEAGRSAFREYSLPRAAITLAQGYGRLLRTRQDRGVVAILDRRMSTCGYGRTLIKSLPQAQRSARLEDVRAFYGGRTIEK
ncbi:MAG: ATP-dependent DNA helicase [Myxococcales bacterium]|nr:ATP-dependent DNA helicase [Myxococcales bacterium]